VAHPSALSELSVIIEADGEDRWIERDGWSDYRSQSREALIERIHQFGVAGLGGAGFPTGVKLRGGGDNIQTLIINAAECEPYITADDRLMQDCAAQVVEGIRILAHILQPREVLIGIEDNKPQAISMLRAVLAGSHDISLRVIPTKYPSGGAKQLTQILTGKQVPHGGRSSDIGVLMQNVGTAYAVKRAVIDGEPLTERVVTLTGESVSRPGNVWARLGTPVRHLLEQAEFCPASDQMVIMGGPLMGFTLPWLDVPVVKITNCLLAPSPPKWVKSRKRKAASAAAPVPMPARRICSRSSCTGTAKASCTTRQKPITWPTALNAAPAPGSAQATFRWCNTSVRRRPRFMPSPWKKNAPRKPRHVSKRVRRDWSAKKSPVRNAISRPPFSLPGKIRMRLTPHWRAFARKSRCRPDGGDPGREKPDNSEAIAAREARKAAARARQAEKAQTVQADTEIDPRKAAVEAAIARAKARKAGEQQVSSSRKRSIRAKPPLKRRLPAPKPVKQRSRQAEAEAPVDPRKAAVEAAIARAKARKAAQQASSRSTTGRPA
jgi:electron transport complex protein RnfC